MAVRRDADGRVEVLPCTSDQIETFMVLAIESVDPRRETTAWHLSFEPPATLDHVVLGEVPQDVHVDVVEAWSREAVNQQDVLLAVRMWQDDGNARAQSFELSDLDHGTVVFGDETMTDAEFDAEAPDPCT